MSTMESIHQDNYRVYNSVIDNLKKELEYKQSQIDTLMLEYCPEDMTPEQLNRWSECQKPYKEI